MMKKLTKHVLLVLPLTVLLSANLQASELSKCDAAVLCKKGNPAKCTATPEMSKIFRVENKLDLPQDTMFTLRQYFYYKGTDTMDCQYFMNFGSEPIIVFRNPVGHGVRPLEINMWDRFGDFAYTCRADMKNCRISVMY